MIDAVFFPPQQTFVAEFDDERAYGSSSGAGFTRGCIVSGTLHQEEEQQELEEKEEDDGDIVYYHLCTSPCL